MLQGALLFLNKIFNPRLIKYVILLLHAQVVLSINIYPVKENGKWGGIDDHGQVCIPIIYERINYAFGSIVPVKSRSKWGVVNSSNKIIIPFEYEFIYLLDSNHIVVYQKNVYSVLNMNKDVLLVSSKLPRLSKGYLFFSDGDKWGCADLYGGIVIDAMYDELGGVNEGYIKFNNGDKWGFLDTLGHIQISAKFTDVGDFFGGLSKAEFYDGWGYINKKGHFVISPQYLDASDFSEGYTAVNIKRDVNPIEDSTGFYSGDEFGSINTVVIDSWVFIDASGKKRIKQSFEAVNAFNDGFSIVKNQGKWGVINLKGDIIIPFDFEYLSQFENGKITGVKNKEVYLLNSKGEILKKYNYSYCSGFFHGFAQIMNDNVFNITKKDTELGYIDYEGEYVWEPRK